jgi:3-phosphoshikimate 1-carboxyvinyltransferase
VKKYTVRTAKKVAGKIVVPGDKSISHRAVMLGSLARGTTVVSGFLQGEDTIATLNAFRQMGVDAREEEGKLLIQGRGLFGLR